MKLTSYQLEQEANKILGIKHSNNMLCVEDMVPSDSYQYAIREKLLNKSWTNASKGFCGDGGLNDGHLYMEEKYFTRVQIKAGMIAEQALPGLLVKIEDTEDDLSAYFWWMINNLCTDHQRQVVHLYYMGLTQQEIATKLNVNQTSVHKTLLGNKCYEGPNIRRYGGVGAKLTKHLKTSIFVQKKMKEMESYQTYKYRLRLPFYSVFQRVIGNSHQYHQWLWAQL
jgi:hypothetical protein